MALRGEFTVDKAVTIEGREVYILREVPAAKADPALTALVDRARRRLEEAKAALANDLAVLRDTRKRAEDAVMTKAIAEAEKQLPVPANADAEEQVRVKAKQQQLAATIAKEQLTKIAVMYSDMPVIDPIK